MFLTMTQTQAKFLCRKYKQAVKGVAESKTTFEKLHQSADGDTVRQWEEQERLSQEQCVLDPMAMDIYDVQLRKGMRP